MEVILLEHIKRLGGMGETVNVKNGYARNYLLPRGKALRANDDNKKRFEQQREELEKRNAEQKKEAEKIAKKIDGKLFVIVRQAGETGQLYGSVATRDIADAITEKGTEVERSVVLLNTPIKSIGLHKVTLHLHPEVDITVTVNVARTQDEAKRQEKGEDLTKRNDNAEARAEAAANAEAIFENTPENESGEEGTQTDAA
ncbi:MAG: 50S ribosomal protein L9 [Pseudomonadota bacterium]